MCASGTRILRTSPNKRWSFKKGMKCGWTSRIFNCQKVWVTSSWAYMWAHSKCWKKNFPTLTSQLRRRKREYLIKWKGYHLIEASWVNESDMEHAQEAIEEFHTRPTKKRRRIWWGHHLSFSGVRSHIKCITSSCKWNKG
jgi:hypothetical protein